MTDFLRVGVVVFRAGQRVTTVSGRLTLVLVVGLIFSCMETCV